MTQRYSQWCLKFSDLRERNINVADSNNKLDIEVILAYAFSAINSHDHMRTGSVNIEQFTLLREGIPFDYVLYFKPRRVCFD